MKKLLFCIPLILAMTLEANASSFIPKVFREAAREHRVPPRVLFALVYHESKRVSPPGHVLPYRPWPWTINFEGEGHYFDSKEDALAYARSLVETGELLFDIGYGQVNWHFHSTRFRSLEDAFDPATNVNVAAEILAEQFYNNDECNSWLKAVGCYHRPARGHKAMYYAKQVALAWKEIKDAEREERLKVAQNGHDIVAPVPLY